MIKKAVFIKSAAAHEGWIVDDIPEVCFMGRSNVGKSSFINSITRQNKLAKTSQTPGKTQLLNFFDINDNEFRIVDCPGYGYSRLSRTKQEDLSVMIQDYMMGRENLKFVCQLIDLRHEPTKDDIAMHNFLKANKIPALIIGTKLDKLKKNDIEKFKKRICTTLNITKDEMIAVSSESKYNIEKIYPLLIEWFNK
ncbi:ribosome biogenesis GTP-binding protein YihA/YsxC [Spiroplasma endosymbiont of Othius punctulatus]|uniref:ribosome biogenesis GTP-binding protein YihA/YsxC n=1 Tax=Spiroplasma endosymbiont of Othius punctulatus TaxID=3066289 RepID=UPI0030D4B8AA